VDAKDEHIRQWLPLAYRVARDYARRYVGTAEADDIQSAAFEGLVAAARTFEPGRSGFYTHAHNMIVWSICRHHAGSNMLMGRGARTHARSRGEEPPLVLSSDAIENFHERVAQGAQSVFDAVADAEQRRQLRSAIAQLPRRTAAAIRLYYFEEMTCAQVGQRLNITRQRADQIIKHGVERVTDLIKKPLRPVTPIRAPVRTNLPVGSCRSWGPADENGFSVHYLCNGTGRIQLRRNGRVSLRMCYPCKGVGHRRLAQAAALAV
jgi:RNA polymerase sigma factor (sigma-70 family)